MRSCCCMHVWFGWFCEVIGSLKGLSPKLWFVWAPGRWQGNLTFLFGMFYAAATVQAFPLPLDTNLQVRLVLYTTNSSGSPSTRIDRDPRNNQVFYLKQNGDIFQVDLQQAAGSTSTRRYSSADHGVSQSALGMAIGPSGIIYIVGNTTTNNGNSTFAQVMKGVPDGSGSRTWSMLARTDPYPRSRTAFDHLMSGMAVSPDGQFLYLNSGARTDHGEVESAGGVYPDLRETAMTAKILRLPANGSNLILPNDINALRAAGYVFAEGTRNAFSLSFSPTGDLFGTDNGPDRDMSDELNWLRPGLHFGFPWRMGGADNPQRFADYNPANDRLLDPRFVAVAGGTYQNDPSFPPVPTNFSSRSSVWGRTPIAFATQPTARFKMPVPSVRQSAPLLLTARRSGWCSIPPRLSRLLIRLTDSC